MRHGSTLRYANLSRGLIGSGHRVHFAVANAPGSDRRLRNEFLTRLRTESCITDFFEVDAPIYPKTLSKIARRMIHPWLGDRMLRNCREGYGTAVLNLLAQTRADVCIVSDRKYLFVVPELRRRAPVLIDWCDSETVYAYREIRLHRQAGKARKAISRLNMLVRAAGEERYYGRRSSGNIVVSPGDKRCLDWLNRMPERNRVLLNGVDPSALRDPAAMLAKDPDTLIFTGSMCFPPNYQAALWFIDHVMPLLIQRHPTVRLTVAGQEPVPELVAQAGNRIDVTAFVPDLFCRIARTQLYVAPMQSGTGFRNKIVEALANGTYVIGTPMALEFLGEDLRNKLLVADSAESFADRILEFLKNPGAYSQRLREATEIVRKEYSWDLRASELEALCRWAAQTDHKTNMTY